MRKFSYMRFEPEGITGNPEIPFAKSMPDYIMRWLASRFIDDIDDLEDLGILTQEVRAKQDAETDPARRSAIDTSGGTAGPANGGQRRQRPRPKPVPAAAAFTDTPPVVPAKMSGLDLGPACEQCGGMMQRTGLLLHVQQLRQQHRLRLSR